MTTRPHNFGNHRKQRGNRSVVSARGPGAARRKCRGTRRGTGHHSGACPARAEARNRQETVSAGSRVCFLVLVAVSRWFLGYEARNSHDTRPLTMHALNITASLAQAVGLLNADLRGNKPQRVACGDVERTRHCCRAACDRRWMRWTLISDQSAKHRPSGCIATAGAAVFSWGTC